MKSNTASSLAALAAVALCNSSSAFAAPFSAPVDITPLAPGASAVVDAKGGPGAGAGPVPSMLPSNATPEDLAIYEGIKNGVKEGLQNALSEALGISIDHDLVREEEVNQALTCIGTPVTQVIIGCIKKENLSMHSPGDQSSQETHTENIQKCIDPTALEHVSYCVGKLEIQRLGEDAKILQQLYEAANLKKEEKLFENPESYTDKFAETELGNDTAPLFNQDWYESHKDTTNEHHDKDLLQGSVFHPSPSTPAPLGPDVKATNSTATAPPTAPVPPPVPGAASSDASKTGDKKDDNNVGPDAIKTQGATDAPFVKRKFGYGPDWRTAPGRRDPHPLARRDLIGDDDNSLGALIVVQKGDRNDYDLEDEDVERLGPGALHLKAHRIQSDMLKRAFNSEQQVSS